MDLWSIGGGGRVSLSWKLFGVMVFHGSMVNWRRRAGVSLSWKLFCVMVFQRSMLNWQRDPSARVGLSATYKHTLKFTLASQRSFHWKTKKNVLLKITWYVQTCTDKSCLTNFSPWGWGGVGQLSIKNKKNAMKWTGCMHLYWKVIFSNVHPIEPGVGVNLQNCFAGN